MRGTNRNASFVDIKLGAGYPRLVAAAVTVMGAWITAVGNEVVSLLCDNQPLVLTPAVASSIPLPHFSPSTLYSCSLAMSSVSLSKLETYDDCVRASLFYHSHDIFTGSVHLSSLFLLTEIPTGVYHTDALEHHSHFA